MLFNEKVTVRLICSHLSYDVTKEDGGLTSASSATVQIDDSVKICPNIVDYEGAPKPQRMEFRYLLGRKMKIRLRRKTGQ